MATTIEGLTHEALGLSEPERASLAQTLLRSLDPDEDAEVDAAWTEEIARRVQRVREGVAQGRPAEDVFRDLRNRCE